MFASAVDETLAIGVHLLSGRGDRTADYDACFAAALQFCRRFASATLPALVIVIQEPAAGDWVSEKSEAALAEVVAPAIFGPVMLAVVFDTPGGRLDWPEGTDSTLGVHALPPAPTFEQSVAWVEEHRCQPLLARFQDLLRAARASLVN